VYARLIDDAAGRVRDLRRAEWEDLTVSGVALGLAVAATELYPTLSLPLFLGGLGVGVLGVRVLWRRWDLIDRLSCEPDAYVIAEVRARAEREATLERRHTFAVCLRTWLSDPTPVIELRLRDAAADIESLAADLDDASLELDPVYAVACMRMLSDGSTSPLLNSAFPTSDLRAQVRKIRSGFRRA
jgi:hypothetical protein